MHLCRFTRNIEGTVRESMTKITIPISLIADYKERYRIEKGVCMHDSGTHLHVLPMYCTVEGWQVQFLMLLRFAEISQILKIGKLLPIPFFIDSALE
jgi:hypothetical protein